MGRGSPSACGRDPRPPAAWGAGKVRRTSAMTSPGGLTGCLGGEKLPRGWPQIRACVLSGVWISENKLANHEAGWASACSAWGPSHLEAVPLCEIQSKQWSGHGLDWMLFLQAAQGWVGCGPLLETPACAGVQGDPGPDSPAGVS